MIPGRSIKIVEQDYGDEKIERVYTQELRPVKLEEFMKMGEDEKRLCRPYTFDPHTYEAAPGIICEQDVAIPLRDGVKIYADIFRPKDCEEKIPAILAWSGYGKRPNDFRPPEKASYTPGVPLGQISPMTKIEAADPAFWCPNHYAVVNVDIRGVGYSEGLYDQFDSQDGKDGYDTIEWLAQQPWCNGKVTMAGTSALAISQWQIAAQQPPHLACIAPWEGMTDMYRESLCEGGIPSAQFTNFATMGSCGLEGVDDMGSMIEKYPFMNAYWEDKIPDFEKIQVPVYATAGWNHFHLRGSVIAWRKAGSKQKWLRAHREFEWPDFYSLKSQYELLHFFDRYCKGIHNGWESTPRVRIDVMDRFDQDAEVERAEDDFPLPRTQYEKLYLDADHMKMLESPVAAQSQVSYDPDTQTAEFDYTFTKDTEITGYSKLHLWVEAADYDDMDLFITLKKVSPRGIEQPVTIFGGTAPHPGAWGKMRVSHRELDPELSSDFQPVQAHKRELKLSKGEVVPVDIEINPFSRLWHAGETLRVQVAGRYIRDKHWIEPLIWDTDNHGDHIVHTGGQYDSYLQIPVIPPKYDDSTDFVVDETKHPEHPMF